MKFIDFFAGIGGFRRGLELAGHECIGFCEFDKFATASYTSMHLITDQEREYLAALSLKKRQKEILKEEYRNGEWYASDIRSVHSTDIPRADCWCFGSPCVDFSIAGKRAGLEGDRSSLIREIFRLLEEREEKDRPEWLIYENVKGMLSSNRGLDYLSILSEMDRLGYDIEWQNINSKWFVPQNRERIYTIGHLRRFGRAKIFPVTGSDGENSVQQLGNYMPTATRDNPNQGRIYDVEGISPCLNSMEGGGREPSIGIKVIGTTNPDMHSLEDIHADDGAMSCLTSRDYKSPKKVGIKIVGQVNSSQDGQVHDISGIAKCHSAGHNNSPKIAIPVIDVAHTEKNQNGKRFKDNGDPMFTLTAQDRHGVGIDVVGICEGKGFVGNESRKRIYSENGIAPCLNGIGCGGNTEPKVALNVLGNLPIQDDGIYVELSQGFTVYAVWYEKELCYITVRKLTPKECFRLQGWTDDYFEKAAFVNSDSQLYKQAGNGATVDVVYAIGKKIMIEIY